MKKVRLLLLFLALVLFQTSCKDTWHPDPEADYATVTLRKEDNASYSISSAFLHNVDTDNDYDLSRVYSEADLTVKVPAGTYYMSATISSYSINYGGEYHYYRGGQIKSSDFTLSKKAEKLIRHTRNDEFGGTLE